MSAIPIVMVPVEICLDGLVHLLYIKSQSSIHKSITAYVKCL